ncbi:n-type atp pyrophosphatase superfamily / tils and ttca-like [hydrocarbon metagenome]|uniref:N-type atp pyrophosphatase superfamily / tils and ttca-like n=1 Tax=hydrocarbon metagenome TaxID=938273 RepID=A0A0W8F0U2_9ZZZZ
MPDLPCSTCHRRAVVYQRYSGLHLCKTHFFADFEAKAKRAIRRHHWIVTGDRIGIFLDSGVSGNALLYFLKRLAGNRRDLELLAITIDEGRGGCQAPPAPADPDPTRGTGVVHISVSFREMFGLTMDEIVRLRGEPAACSCRDVLLRRCFTTLAREYGMTKIALGSTLDDDAGAVLMAMIRGEAERLLWPPATFEGCIPRISPFRYIPGQEVALYATLQTGDAGAVQQRSPCTALEADLPTLLDKYTGHHPSAKYALVNIGDSIASCSSLLDPAVAACPSCGEPCIGVCSRCRMVEELLQDR